jgi:hypothetical protein
MHAPPLPLLLMLVPAQWARQRRGNTPAQTDVMTRAQQACQGPAGNSSSSSSSSVVSHCLTVQLQNAVQVGGEASKQVYRRNRLHCNQLVAVRLSSFIWPT